MMKNLEVYKPLDLDWIISLQEKGKTESSSKEVEYISKEDKSEQIIWRSRSVKPPDNQEVELKEYHNWEIVKVISFIGAIIFLAGIFLTSLIILIISFAILIPMFCIALVQAFTENGFQNAWYKVSDQGITFLYPSVDKSYFLRWHQIQAIELYQIGSDLGNIMFIPFEYPGFKTTTWKSKFVHHDYPTMINIPMVEKSYQDIISAWENWKEKE